MEHDQSKPKAGDMLTQKTNEDFNKKKPGPEDLKVKSAKTYTCPNHAEVKMDVPGKCSKCGSDLTESK